MHELEELAGEWEKQAVRLAQYKPGQPAGSRHRDDIESRVLLGCAADLRSRLEEIRQLLRNMTKE